MVVHDSASGPCWFRSRHALVLQTRFILVFVYQGLPALGWYRAVLQTAEYSDGLINRPFRTRVRWTFYAHQPGHPPPPVRPQAGHCLYEQGFSLTGGE